MRDLWRLLLCIYLDGISAAGCQKQVLKYVVVFLKATTSIWYERDMATNERITGTDSGNDFGHDRNMRRAPRLRIKIVNKRITTFLFITIQQLISSLFWNSGFVNNRWKRDAVERFQPLGNYQKNTSRITFQAAVNVHCFNDSDSFKSRKCCKHCEVTLIVHCRLESR